MPRSHHAGEEVPEATPSSTLPLSGSGEVVAEEGNNPLTVEKLLPRHPLSRNNFLKDPPPTPNTVFFETKQVHLDALRIKYGIPAHVEMIPAGEDYVDVHKPGYCAFYEYPFVIGYTLPLFPLAEEFSRFYQVCPTQLSPYMLKVLLLLTKYVELAESSISIHHLLHLFAPGFLRGTMVHLRLRGTKGWWSERMIGRVVSSGTSISSSKSNTSFLTPLDFWNNRTKFVRVVVR